MFRNERVTCIVPARGGSKRFPRKNLFPLCGKPLIVWTLEAARNVGIIDDIIVSTDDEEIADVCGKHGFPVDALRPAHLAADNTTTVEAVRFELERRGLSSGWLLLLQPTSPVREARHIKAAFELLDSSPTRRLVSMSPVPVNPKWIHVMGPNGVALPAFGNAPSELLAPNGAIYVARIEEVRDGYAFEAAHALALLMDKSSSIDVDDLEDMYEAQMALQARVAI